ncbi:hypothetical protein [Candidatus Electronema sp. TJ]|uniref:hypothetical protein n=1 Tax=Candidatus Electronema sp. TJ TaxID=3401573 RepID=UPI003AA9D43C
MRVSAWVIAAMTISGMSAFAQVAAADEGEPASFRVYMPDGQLKSHPIRVYVTTNISSDQKPQLRLLRNHLKQDTSAEHAEAADEEAALVAIAPHQEWTELVSGQQTRQQGTLMLFDVSKMSFGCKSMTRVTPVVSWNNGKRVAIGAREVNVGSIAAAVLWTLFIVGLVLATLIRLSRNKPLLFLSGADGHLSLAKTQVACWTVAVGSVVLSYGLIRLDIPNIPQSLLALMGASLVTGGVAALQKDNQAERKTESSPAASPSLTDLVRAHASDGHMSLAKAQMLFWTVLLLLLFVSKSLLDGAIWEVPWELVALMGFSQAGYLAPKLVPQPAEKKDAQPGSASLS